MAGLDDEREDSAGLAERAGPVRIWLTRFFRRKVGRDADVEDMVQDVFVRVAARDSREPIAHLNGYLLQTASHVLADALRLRQSRRSHLHVAFDADLHGDAAFDADRILSGKEELHATLAALLSLPERTRTVFILRRLEGYRIQDIAAHVGISVSAVEKHLLRAVRHLHAELEKRRGS